jgi:hypothetical protein
MDHNYYCHPVFQQFNNDTHLSLDELQRALEQESSWSQVATHFYAWSISGVFTFWAIFLTLKLIYRHCQYYTKPEYQRHIVR